MPGWRDGYYRHLLMQVSDEEEHLDDPETYITLKIGERRHQPTLTEREEMENTYAAVQRNLQADGRPRQLLGKTVGGYRVLFALEQQGGMAEVYVAKWGDSVRNSYVLKASKRNGGTKQLACCFEEEAEALRRIQDDTHLATFAASGFDEANQVDFIVTERVEGRSLHKLVRCLPQGQPFPGIPASEAVDIILQVLEGVSELHRLRIIHRDLTPCNIILGRDGVAKVIDLGLAVHLPEEQDLIDVRATAAGTPWFRPPEQEESGDRQVGFRSDVYSLGKTLYFLLRYRPSWEPARMGEKGQWPPDQLLQTDAELWEGIDPGLADVIQTAVHPHRERRYPTVRAFSEALRKFAPATSSPETLIGRLQYPPPDGVLDLAIGEDLAKLTSPHPPPRVPVPNTIWPMAKVLGGIGVALSVIVLVVMVLVNSGHQSRPEGGENGGARSPVPFKGYIDLLLTDGGPQRQKLRLRQPGALPLREGDFARLEVEINRKGFLYIVWVDAEGEPTPVYPEDWKWDQQPQSESPRDRLVLPEESQGKDAPLAGGASGTEVVLLLVRETPLGIEAGAGLRKTLAKLQSRTRIAHSVAWAWASPRLTVADCALALSVAGATAAEARRMEDPGQLAIWLENGEVVQDEPHRGPLQLAKARKMDDLIDRVQRLMRQDLKQSFVYTRAVCYSFRGTKK